MVEQDSVDCAVIVVTYNSERDISSLLDSLPAGAPGLTLRTIVVDNGSVDGTVDVVRARTDVLCIEIGANLGFAGGINVGRQYAAGSATTVVLNPDLVLEPGALTEMFAAAQGSGVGIVVPMLLELDGTLYPSLRREPTLTRAIGDALLGSRLPRRPGWLTETVMDPEEYKHSHSVDWAGGAALLVSAACDSKVGAWDERFFLYSEEVDYATRTRAAGFRVQYVPAAKARHRGSGSGQSAKLTALMAVSRVRYVEKHGRHAVAYRAAVILHELLRATSPGHRFALRTLLRRTRWAPLTAGLQSRPAQSPVPTAVGLSPTVGKA